MFENISGKVEPKMLIGDKKNNVLVPLSDKSTWYTWDDFMGGAVRLLQHRSGYRVAMDTVLLQAAVPARSGQTVLEGGVGSAGAALCLARRIKGVKVEGVDIQADMLALARQNIVANQLEDFVRVFDGNIKDLATHGSDYDHVMINPPYLEKGAGHPPGTNTKSLAHVNSSAVLRDWLRFAVHHTKARGSVTIIYRADQIDKVIAGLAGKVGDIRIFPLWPKFGKRAKRVIVQGLKGSKGSAVFLPGMVLHGDSGERYSLQAEDILRRGAGLDLNNFGL